MKKFFLTLLSAILCFSLFAQETEPNRLLIHDKSNNVTGYIIDQVDYIDFATVEGEVAADVEILNVELDQVSLKIMRTAECQAFKLTCVPAIHIASYNDVALAKLIDADTPNLYYQDFEEATLEGIVLEPNTDYAVLTVGVDSYGVLCDVRKAVFTTPSLPTVGNPEVVVTNEDIQKSQFTLSFSPNADVSRYAFVAGAKGEIQAQYAMFAPMLGFSNIGQMIEMWGVSATADTTFTWENMSPGTEYEVFVQAWDSEGTAAPYVVHELTTVAIGGEGVAEVAITLGDYVLADWWGEILPGQFITFTPNDQSSAYRLLVCFADEYDALSENIKSELCMDPPTPMSGWFYYDEVIIDYQINPNTECVAIAAAKNINGEWGPITELRFTTPAIASDPVAAPSKVIKKRTPKAAKQAGVVPAMRKPQLVER